MIKPGIFILLLFCAVGCRSSRNTAINTDHAKLQGVWLAQTESLNGVIKEVNFQYIFKGNEITFIDETGKEVKYSFILDTSNNPRLLIIRPADPKEDPKPVGVGYELKGDRLTIVVAPPGLRPADISDKNNQELIACKRKGS